ncbi:MAG: hemolysin III family protein [Propionibacteriales bacterium]|nr:hemolysin III family protein [Propionibacteriales bacterium]
METIPLSKDGSVHVTDERANTATHLAAACLALVGSGLLITQASVQAEPVKIVAVSIYCFTLLALFTFSALHHGIDGSPQLNELLRTFDYISVFLLIPGTMTPLVLVLFLNPYGIALLGASWAIAAAGIVLRSVWQRLPKYVTNTLYITLGWVTVLLLGAGHSLPVGALILIAAGGLVYSAGFVVFVIEKPNPWPGVFGFHELWHVLVVIAAALHYLAIYWYVLPA